MARPKGSKNKPGSRKPGRKENSTSIPKQFTDNEIIEYKVLILQMMVDGKAQTVTSACRTLGIPPTRGHGWLKGDPDFKELVEMVGQVIADEIEEDFRVHGHFIPRMMLLKRYRPEFRETYKFDIKNDKLEELLERLRVIKEKPKDNGG